MKMRVHRPADAQALRASDSPLEIDQSDLARGIDWVALFGQDRPVEVEIGCGKGLFLSNAAAAHPDVSWFALERSSAHLRRAIDRVVKARLSNVRFTKAQAEDFLEQWAPDASVRAVHLLYPDPWPKKRHHKRRLLGLQRGPVTVGHLARVIVPGGQLAVATDHTGYAQAIEEVLEGSADFERTADFHSQSLMPDPEAPLTEFDRKYRREGRPSHRMCWRRV